MAYVPAGSVPLSDDRPRPDGQQRRTSSRRGERGRPAVAPGLHVPDGMLEAARPEARGRVRSHPQRLSWGIVDVILAIVMLPFAIWMLVIDRMVAAISAVFSR